jgi:hypothetical protein
MPNDDKPDAQNQDSDDVSPGGFPLKPAGEVAVTHLDSPPPAGEKTIHPRRIAPIVPTVEERAVRPSPRSGQAGE